MQLVEKRNVSSEYECHLIASTIKWIHIYSLNCRSVYCCMQNISQTVYCVWSNNTRKSLAPTLYFYKSFVYTGEGEVNLSSTPDKSYKIKLSIVQHQILFFSLYYFLFMQFRQLLMKFAFYRVSNSWSVLCIIINYMKILLLCGKWKHSANNFIRNLSLKSK